MEGLPEKPEQSPVLCWEVAGLLFLIAKSGWLDLNSFRQYEKQKNCLWNPHFRKEIIDW